MKAEIILFRM